MIFVSLQKIYIEIILKIHRDLYMLFNNFFRYELKIQCSSIKLFIQKYLKLRKGCNERKSEVEEYITFRSKRSVYILVFQK